MSSFMQTYVDIPSSASLSASGISSDSTSFSVYPNPINKTTVVEYQQMKDGDVAVELINNAGEVIKSFRLESQKAGLNSIVLDASEIRSGLYYCRLKLSGQTITRRIFVSK